MDWSKLFKLKIHDTVKFLVILLALICLLLFLVISINAVALDKSLNIENFFEITKGIFRVEGRFWAPEQVIIFIFILIVLFITVGLRTFLSFCKRNFIYLTLPKIWYFNKDFQFECFNDLEIQGRVTRYIKGPDRGFKITSSDSGVLFKNLFWRDCKIDFDFNFDDFKSGVEWDYVTVGNTWKYEQVFHKPRNNYFGLLFRAQDLDNYFMIQIGVKEMIRNNIKSFKGKDIYGDKVILIKPLVKVDGNWEVYTNEKRKLEGLKIKDFNHLACKLKGNILTLSADKAIKDFEWLLPSKFHANYKSQNVGETKSQEIIAFGDQTTIPFRNRCGMLGFRAYDEERVIIKNLKVTKLST